METIPTPGNGDEIINEWEIPAEDISPQSESPGAGAANSEQENVLTDTERAELEQIRHRLSELRDQEEHSE